MPTQEHYKSYLTFYRHSKFYHYSIEHLNECLPKMFKNESYKVNVVYSMEVEQIESEKIENPTIPKKKQYYFLTWSIFK